MKTISIAAIALLSSTYSALAGDFILGIGVDDLDGSDSGSATFQLEYHTDPLREYRWGSISGFVVAQVDDDSDTFVGAGFSAIKNLNPKWFLEGSLAAGFYEAGRTGTDLGGDFQFRTLVGVGYRLSESSRISVAIDHISNGGFNSRNPGREALSIRYGMKF
jgi:hypothetical protein